MSLIATGLQVIKGCVQANLLNRVASVQFSRCSAAQNAAGSTGLYNLSTREITKDRTNEIPVARSIAYLKSRAYQETYGGRRVWESYRRNYKGWKAPPKTRKTCIRGGMLSTGNPCPICRDEYLVLDYRNVMLLNQFISEYNGEILSYSETGICQKRHQELIIAIMKAKDQGLITFDVPFREYDYSEWTPSDARDAH